MGPTRPLICISPFGSSRVIRWILIASSLVVSFALNGCTAMRSSSLDCSAASCVMYKGVELSVSHVDRNYILTATSSASFYVGATTATMTVDTIPLPTVGATPRAPGYGQQPGATTPNGPTRPPAVVTVPPGAPGFHYIRLELEFANGSEGSFKVSPSDVRVTDPTGKTRAPVNEPGCAIGKPVLLAPGRRFGPSPSCFMVTGPVHGRLRAVWPWPGGTSVELH